MASVAAGSYVVYAKTTVVQTGTGGGGSSATRCTLDAGGGSTDYGETDLGKSAGESGRATLSMNVTAVFTATGTIVVRCRLGSPQASVARQTKIIIVKVDTATRAAVTG